MVSFYDTASESSTFKFTWLKLVKFEVKLVPLVSLIIKSNLFVSQLPHTMIIQSFSTKRVLSRRIVATVLCSAMERFLLYLRKQKTSIMNVTYSVLPYRSKILSVIWMTFTKCNSSIEWQSINLPPKNIYISRVTTPSGNTELQTSFMDHL